MNMSAEFVIAVSGAFVVGLALGLGLMALTAGARRARLQAELQRLPQLEEELRGLQDEKLRLHEEIAALKAYRQADEERLGWLDRAQEAMREAFAALAGQSLRANSEDILRAHKEQLHTLVEPLDKTLQEMRRNLQELEGKREGAYGELRQNLEHLFQASRQLQLETGKLSHALKSGIQQRGRWAEIQLQRLVELAGMRERVDFDLQAGVGEGRPDMIVRLPRGGCIVVDAKAPLQHFLEALESASEDGRRKGLGEHARRVKQHVEILRSKEYLRHLPEGSQFVVMYLPSDACLTAALEADHQLLEYAFERHVILATPTTIFALLKTVATGWQQYLIDENARLILTRGQELFERLKKFTEHFAGIGKGLKTAVDKYNEAVGSYESRLLPEIRRFQELRGASPETLPPVKTVNGQPRPPALPDPSENPLPD